MNPQSFFSKAQTLELQELIGVLEQNTSAELRIHIENSDNPNALERAAEVFQNLGMEKTKNRSGVLMYLNLRLRKFAIYVDSGLHELTGKVYWDKVCERMEMRFKKAEFLPAMSEALKEIGADLAKYFPIEEDDENELDNEISFGE